MTLAKHPHSQMPEFHTHVHFLEKKKKPPHREVEKKIIFGVRMSYIEYRNRISPVYHSGRPLNLSPAIVQKIDND